MSTKSCVSSALAIAFGLTIASSSLAQVSQQQVQTLARPSTRINTKINNAVTMRLPGTHPAIVDHAAIGNRVAASRQLSHLMLVLNPTNDQDSALHTLLEQQQDKTSPNYHKWLTPETYGQLFGAASSDVAQITSWLQDQGFAVDSVAKGNRIIVFSGNVGQVEAAFHTQMNHLTVDGEAHISNVTDIEIPQALSGVVMGVAALNDFVPKSQMVGAHKAELVTNIPSANYITPEANPLYTSTSSGSHYVTPGDAAVIFNSTPLLKSGIDGTGQKIAVIGRTAINLSDVQQFRSMFGLKKLDPTITLIGSDPGTTSDDGEADLDVEWAGGMAPNAAVTYYYSGSDYFTTSGIGSSALYAVDNNAADIITLSYGGCETSNGSSGTAFWNTLWQQAAAQGQTVFVSSGDSNATGCQSSSATYGTAYGVNGLGSGAYNVAVGGTMFVDYGPSQYWTTGTTAPAPAGYSFQTALGYMPEAVWNQGALTTTYLNTLSTATQTGSGIVGAGGGLSIYTPRPSWQTGSGISPTADATCSSGTCIAANSTGYTTHRMVPDISFIAASGHDASVYCSENSCYSTSNGFGIGAVGGTSVATPVMASVQALINQKNGGRQGNANFYYYPLANRDYIAGNCKSVNGTASAPTVVLPAATCNFHDVVAGDNRSKQNSTDTVGLGFYAGTGYDAASGLGTVNINTIANNWNTVNFNSTATTFTLTPLTGITHGASQTLSVTVSSTAGTPTGDFSLIAVTTNPSTIQRYTLTSGAYSGSISGLPAGTYNVYVHYAGDGTFAPSDSATRQVTIAQESSTITPVLSYFYNGYLNTPVTSIPYGYLADLYATVAGASATGVPTGTMTFTPSLNSVALTPLTVKLDGAATGTLIAAAGYSAILLNPNYPALAPGNYTVAISYSGDTSFAASSTSTSFTVTQQTPAVTLTVPAYITSGASVTLTCTAANPAGLTPTLSSNPTGTCTFTNTTTSTPLGTVTLNSAGIGTLTTTALTTSGANVLSATYNGDTNYAATTSATKTVTVGALTSTTTTLAVTAGTYYVLTTTPLTATVTPAVSGTVYFYDGGVLLGSATSSGTTGNATFNATTLTAGSHTLSAAFAGTSAYTASTGSTTLTVLQNVTTTIMNAPTNSVVGQTVALSARVARSPNVTSAGAVPLTGTVTFYDGSTALGTATPIYLPGGYYYYVATLAVSNLARGPHSFTATYSGDANFAGSTTTGTVKMIITPNNIWVANSNGSVTGLTNSGSSVATTSGGGKGIAIDNVGDIWSLNMSGNSVAEFSNTGTVISGGYTGGGINAPTALAIDGAGMVWITNSNSTVSVLSNAGAAVSGSSGYPTTTSTPSSLSIDASGNLWITNAGDNSLTEVIGAAAPVSTPTTKAVTNNSLATKP